MKCSESNSVPSHGNFRAFITNTEQEDVRASRLMGDGSVQGPTEKASEMEGKKGELFTNVLGSADTG